MRAVVQRVSRAAVSVEDEIVGQIGPGLLVLLGVTHDDDTQIAAAMAEKVARLRILRDGNRMHLGISTGGHYLSEDSGRTFAPSNKGIGVGFAPGALTGRPLSKPRFQFCLTNALPSRN